MPCHCYYRLTLTRRRDLLSSSGFEDLKSSAAWDEGRWRWSRQPWPLYSRTHKHTTKHDYTQTLTTPSQEARVKLRFPLCVFKNPQMTITADLINWEGGEDSWFFYEGPAVRVSLAVIYMARERQGESLYCWAGARAQTSNTTLQHSSSLL